MSKERHSGTAGRFRRWEWGKQIKEGQPAYAWGRFITPLYGIKVVGFLADMTYSVGSRLCFRPVTGQPAAVCEDLSAEVKTWCLELLILVQKSTAYLAV